MASYQSTSNILDALPSPATFTLFPRLPLEIQLQIWSHALPPPRTVDGGMVLIVGRNLSTPRAILPSVKDHKSIYREYHQRDLFVNFDFDAFLSQEEGSHVYDEHAWAPAEARSLEGWHPILTTMWTCRTSRSVARKTYRLDIESIIESERKSWWADGQRVYFPPPRQDEHFDARRHTQLTWLITNERKCFHDLEHATLYLEEHLMERLDNHSFWHQMAGQRGMPFSPNLMSLTFVLDPDNEGWQEQGRLLYYEPYDVPIMECHNKTPAEFRRWVADRLFLAPAFKMVDREAPDLNVFVMGVGEGKWPNLDN